MTSGGVELLHKDGKRSFVCTAAGTFHFCMHEPVMLNSRLVIVPLFTAITITSILYRNARKHIDIFMDRP